MGLDSGMAVRGRLRTRLIALTTGTALAAAGLTPPACRQGARALELAALRGPRPEPGLAGLRRAIANYLEDERPGIRAEMAALAQQSPFRKDGEPD